MIIYWIKRERARVCILYVENSLWSRFKRAAFHLLQLDRKAPSMVHSIRETMLIAKIFQSNSIFVFAVNKSISMNFIMQRELLNYWNLLNWSGQWSVKKSDMTISWAIFLISYLMNSIAFEMKNYSSFLCQIECTQRNKRKYIGRESAVCMAYFYG